MTTPADIHPDTTDPRAFLAWCLAKALPYVDAGDADGALDSLMSDTHKYRGSMADVAGIVVHAGLIEAVATGRDAITAACARAGIPTPPETFTGRGGDADPVDADGPPTP